MVAEFGEMVLFVPDTMMLTVLALTGLLKASSKVIVTVVVAVLSATTISGEMVTVDLLADTAPEVKVTVAVLIKFRLSVVSVAEIVLVSAFVDLMVAVVCPPAFVATAG